jgi:hypothetical protein
MRTPLRQRFWLVLHGVQVLVGFVDSTQDTCVCGFVGYLSRFVGDRLIGSSASERRPHGVLGFFAEVQ